MARRPANKIEQDNLLALLPPGTKKVQVKTELGHLKYKSLDELADSDEIQVKGDGTPVVMTKTPGRKANLPTVLAPATPMIGQLVKEKSDFIDKDPILKSARENPDSSDLLNHVVVGLTEEAASLAFERSQAERKGEETSSISIRRVNALKAVGDTWLKRKEQLVGSSFDVDSPAFKEFLKILSGTFRNAMEEASMRDELIDTVFAKVSKAMDEDWVNDVKNRMKSAGN